MKKTYLKNKNGVTIIALIIIIMVMIVLAGVGILSISPNGLIDKTDQVQKGLSVKQIIEEIHSELDYKYYLQTGRELPENIVEEAANKLVKAGVSGKKITICHDKKNNEDLIFYRYNLVTVEEIEKLELENIKMLKADYNLDGMVNEEDYKVLREYNNGDLDDIDGIEIWGDIIYNDGVVDSNDEVCMSQFLNGDISLKDLCK